MSTIDTSALAAPPSATPGGLPGGLPPDGSHAGFFDVLAGVGHGPEDLPGDAQGGDGTKIRDRQAYRLVLNLGRTDVTREQVEALPKRGPVAGLQELFIIKTNGAISRIFSNPEQITPAPQAR